MKNPRFLSWAFSTLPRKWQQKCELIKVLNGRQLVTAILLLNTMGGHNYSHSLIYLVTQFQQVHSYGQLHYYGGAFKRVPKRAIAISRGKRCNVKHCVRWLKRIRFLHPTDNIGVHTRYDFLLH